MITTHTTRMQGRAGSLEVDIDEVEECTRGIAFLAHPLTTEGGTKDHKVIVTMARSLQEAGFLVVRPNLRGAGRSEGTYDGGFGETDDFLAVIEQSFELPGLWELLPAGGQVIYGGFSFGTYVSLLAADVRRPAGLVLAGCAAGRYPLPAPATSAFIVHGERDTVIPLTDVFGWADVHDLPVTVIPGADHCFSHRLPALRQFFDRSVAVI